MLEPGSLGNQVCFLAVRSVKMAKEEANDNEEYVCKTADLRNELDHVVDLPRTDVQIIRKG